MKLGKNEQKLGKNELEEIKKLEKSEARKMLETLIRNKDLRKEVRALYVIYKYLETFSKDSVLQRIMNFRIGEGLPLDRMYVKLRIVRYSTPPL